MSQPEHGCPVCALRLREAPSRRGRRDIDLLFYDCPRCGRFGLTRQAQVRLPSWIGGSVRSQTILSYALRRLQIAEDWPPVDSTVLERISETGTLPAAQEQADNLVRWLGTHLPGPGEVTTVSFLEHGAIMGAHAVNGFIFIVRGLIDTGVLLGSIAGGSNASVTLSFAGWRRVEELRLGAPSGRNAFMAMEYGDTLLDQIVNSHLRPGVAQTGFNLKRLDEDPKAGLIDDRLRVEIQGSRFLIADLTHRNPGAYWEAGYAEGLGKPVIYLCERSVFLERSHFDTNHHLHVLWEAADLPDAVNRLKATIRATVPEAKREDE
jgi:hypothetical protein